MESQFGKYAAVFVTCTIIATSAVFRDTVCRSDTEVSCLGEQCIPIAQECDGRIHCADGSDETLQRCRERTGRPLWPIIFHCNVDWARDLYQGVCPDVCHHQQTQEYCTYAILAEYDEPKTCKLPSFPEHGHYQVEDVADTDTFSLYYSCEANYDLDEPNYPRCDRGRWINKHPNCKLITGSPGVDDEDIRK